MDYSQILQQAYEQFLLPLGGKKVPTPYRINIPFQPDRKKYGKSDPQTLTKDVQEFAKEQDFDLNKASIEEIRAFMEGSWLGIDCSGFTYHLLNHFLKKIGKGGMEDIGFPKASNTNVEILTSDQFSIPITIDQAQPGDLIKLNSDGDGLHTVIIINRQDNRITYAHSSNMTKIKGVHQDEIVGDKFPEELSVYTYNTQKGDGGRRLKVLKEDEVQT